MGPKVNPVETNDRIPEKAEVVIVGGGIIGTSAALFLARRGVSVVLCEKGQIAGEQSSRNWGWIRKAKRDPRELPLMFEGVRLWERMNEMVEAETGYRRTSMVFAAETDDQAGKYEKWIESSRGHQVGARMISGKELDDVMPGASRHWKGAMYSPAEARAEPQFAASAIATAARRAGAVILANCAVRGAETKGGRITAAVTERGHVGCNALIVAGGAWSSRFLRDLGVRLPQLKVRTSVLRTAPLDGPDDVALWCKEASFRKRADGGYTIGNGFAIMAPIVPDSFRFFREYLPILRMEWSSIRPRVDESFLREWRHGKRVPHDRASPYESVRILDPEPDREANRTAVQDLARLFPVFASAEIVQEWAGMIDVTPDVLPVISTVDGVPGLVVATGFSGHGFGIGPAAGRLAAELATGSAPVVDATPFRLSRFTDGSGIHPSGGI